MLDKQLEVMHRNNGFIAALDQSGGSTPKALLNYGILESSYKNDDEMFNLVHEMRKRIITSPSFNNDLIVGSILFENTMDRKIDEYFTADYLWKVKGIVPFLKIDKGLMSEKDGVLMMKPIPLLDELLEKATKRNIFGTKMRSVINSYNELGIKNIVKQQFEVAKIVIKHKLVPIIEPEVSINALEKERIEDFLLLCINEELDKLKKDDKVIFKLTLPTVNNLYYDLSLNPKVVRVVALSGGYSRKKSVKLLSKNKNVIASFSRAFTEGLNVNQNDKAFDKLLLKSAKAIYKASIR